MKKIKFDSNLKKKAISPVVAITLLLIMAVYAVVNFQTWYNTYSSDMFVKLEQDSSESSDNSGIEDLIDNTLYFKNGNQINITIVSVKIGGQDCNISGPYTPGMKILNVTSCINNLSTNTPNIVVITDKKIYQENIYIDNLLIGGGSGGGGGSSFTFDGNLSWNKTVLGFSYASGIAIDSSDNIFITGEIGNQSVSKFDSSFNSLWNVSFDNTDGDVDQGIHIVTDSQGNSYSIGYSDVGAGFDYHYNLIKYNASGDFEWNFTYDSGAFDTGFGVDIDSSENIYITGYVTETLQKMRTFKLDSDMNIFWNVTFGVTGQHVPGRDIRVKGSYFYLTGGSGDIHTVKYDLNGNQIWNTSFDWGGSEVSKCIDVDSAGNVYVGGHTNVGGTGDDYLLIKYDSSGVHQWNRTYTNQDVSNTDRVYGIGIDSNDDIYITGESLELTDGTNIITFKYNSSGDRIWNATYMSGTGLSDEGYDIAFDSNDDVYIVGETDFDSIVIKYE
ncbi:MAG: SBBP repeat-containing protein [Nanoarchaeota archaeon]|nr:SBBP repeat-containing protein [Nanoarchaeota archaeon]